MRNEKSVSIFLSSGKKEKSQRGFGRIRGAFAAGSLVALAALMTGCGDIPDAVNPGHWWDATFGDDEDQAAPPEKSAGKPATAAASTPSSAQTAQATAETAPALPPSPTAPQASSGQQPYPKIQDVPQRPETSTLEERRKIMQGLAADKANARYTDEAARASAGTAAPAAPAPASAGNVAAPPAKVAEAAPATPPMPPPSPPAAAPSSSSGNKKTYVSGLDTGPVAPPPAPPIAPNTSMPPVPNAAPPATAPMSAEAVTPPALGSSELDQIYASKLRESAPTVTTAPAGPTSAVAGADTAAIAEPPEKPAKGKHGKAKASSKMKGSGAPSASSSPSVQVFDTGYDGGYVGTYQAAYNNGNDGYDGPGMLPGQVGTIYFSNGSAQISESDRAKLSQVVAQYRGRGGMIRVVGHASSFTRDMAPSQHDMVNYNISARRADAVAQALMKLGVRPENINVTAEADRDPVYYEVMPAGEAGNRRVEIFIDY